MTKWPADHVERRPIDGLIPYARNARQHSDAQVAQIAASMREWGWTNPVLVDEAGTIIAGHGRVLAARSMGMTEVPVMTAVGWTEAQKRAYCLADNQLTLNGVWDDDLLKIELQGLKEWDFDLGLLGFADLDALLAGHEGLTDPDAVPDAPAVPVATCGDLWALGRHRLLCGDATSAQDTQKVLQGVSPHLMVTDPPYGVDYDPDWRNQAKRAGSMKAYGASSTGQVINDERADWREAWTLFPGDVAYVWHGALHASTVADGLASARFEIRAQIIWAKQHAPISRGHYHWQHEPCWYAVRRGSTGSWAGDRTQTTLWQIANANAFGGQDKELQTNHGTQKPVECMKRPIENNSSPGQAVYDPFVGSGTTIVAAEMTGRACHAIEIDPAYVDVCITRWQNFTGQQATLDGRPFADVATERLGADYSPRDDLNKSVNAAYDVIKQRVANGGPGYEVKNGKARPKIAG